MKQRFVIIEAKSMEEPDGPDFWNNTDGWGDRASAELYQPDEMYDVVLPIGGAWLPDYELEQDPPEPEQDLFQVDLRVHFAYGHPYETAREAWLRTVEPGVLSDYFHQVASDEFWTALDTAVNDTAVTAGYPGDPREDDE